MKTLVIDARMIGPFGHGISKYLEERVSSFGDHDELSKKILQLLGLRNWKELRLVFLVRKDCPESSPVRRFETYELNLSPYHPFSWVGVPRALKKLKADLFFNPTFASYPYLPCEFVQTVHDLNHLVFGGILQKSYYRFLLKRSIHQAALVFTVSDTVKKELISWSGMPVDRFWVTHNLIEAPVRVDEARTAEVLAKYGLQRKKFFFAIAADKPHKNVDFLSQEHEKYMQKQNGSVWSNAFRSISGEQDFPLKAVSGISNEELSVLYRECAAFCFPSLYEGFGRPPVEAALAGTKVLASDIPVHREAKEWLTGQNPSAGELIQLLKV